MHRSLIALLAAAAVVVPTVAHADSDGYYCIGPNYIAYQFGFGAPTSTTHRLFVIPLGGSFGIGAPASITLPSFQMHGMTCGDRAVRLRAYDAVYTVPLDAARKPLRADRMAITPGTVPPEFVGLIANLGEHNRAASQLNVDTVTLMKDSAGHVFTLLVRGDTTATRWCDPDVQARIVQTAPTGAVVRERIIPHGEPRPAACPSDVPVNPPVPHVEPPPPSTVSAVHIESAYSEQDGAVCFELPKGFANWASLAAQARGAAAVANPPRDTLRAHYMTEYRAATLRYAMRPAQSIASASWLVFTESDVTTTPATELRGEINYQVNRGLRVIYGPEHRGKACGRDRTNARAAFVVAPSTPGAWTSAPVRVEMVGAREYAVTVNGNRYTFVRDSPKHPGVRVARVIHPPSGPALLLVAWPDDQTCTSNYVLFELGAGREARELRANAYGCDV